ncbi:FliM/FliN family flagellar motor switch protein [Paracoccus sp. (in: a-proteobacteria)]|uniref:FliM/FliN family flagellar motor switch protein n=1 Tax=Paracoccus sp. TaxID=267 RepID=UPI00391C5FD6
MTPARTAATALGRVAERLFGMAVQPLSVKADAMTLAELTELLPERPLLALLQGPGDSLGAMAICPEMVAALVEMQALGRVTRRPLERRPPTRSEAMLCAEFIDMLMAELQSEMAGLEGFESFDSFRFAASLEDPRPLALLLDDRPFRSLSFQLSLGSPDAREGSLLLALPQPHRAGRGAEPHTDDGTRPPARGPMPALAAPGLRPDAAPAIPSVSMPADALPDVPVELVGILCRRQASLGELRALGPGRVLHLPRVRLSDARVETTQGQLVAQGKLGEAEGCHAIRLRDPAMQGDDMAVLDGPRFGGSAAPEMAAAMSQLDETGENSFMSTDLPLADLSEPDMFLGDPGADAASDSPIPGHLDRAAG